MTRLSRKEAQERTRIRLKEAAERLLERRGAGSLRIEEIAREAGFTRGAFYANYAHRLALLAEVMEDRLSREMAFWQNLFAKAPQGEADLGQVVSDALALRRPWALINLELHLEAERNEEFRPHFMRYIDAIQKASRDVFVALLERSGKAIPADLDDQIAGARALGHNLALPSVLGFAPDNVDTARRLMSAYVADIVDRAPPAPLASSASATPHAPHRANGLLHEKGEMP